MIDPMTDHKRVVRYDPDAAVAREEVVYRGPRMTVSRVRLGPRFYNATFGFNDTAEGAVHLLSGAISLTTPRGKRVQLARRGRSVFTSQPEAAVFAGRYQSDLGVFLESEFADLLLVKYKRESELLCDAAMVSAKDVRTHIIGSGSHKRLVREVLGENAPGCIKVGETINPPGKWSSWPPHDFEKDITPQDAQEFEEAFVYFTNPRDGRALQTRAGFFADGKAVNDVVTVYNGDVAAIPLGSHAVVAAPDTTLLYVWVYAGPFTKRYAKWSEDQGGYR